MITPTSFAIHVTYTCPLSCAHCCFSSSPTNRDRLGIDHILETIRCIDTSSVKMIAFTGGEPFLLGQQLTDAIRLSHSRGLVTRVVTSAFWAKTPDISRKKLNDLHKAGLDELSISWDDFHEEFVHFECVFNAFTAAKETGIRVAVNIVQSGISKWNAVRLRQELGLGVDDKESIVESPLNLTGRAESMLKDVGLRPKRLLGPCPYVLTGPTLSAKNKLLACCGVIPDTEALTLDPNFKPENLQKSLEAGLSSPLLNWIYLRGPYSIMEWISGRFNVDIPDVNSVGGNCEACRRLFETREIAERIPEAISERSKNILDEIELLGSLGMAEPKFIAELWNSQSAIESKPALECG